MHKIRGSTNTGQLSLLDNFDRLARRDQKLVDELRAHISNIKYFRVNTRYAETENKAELDEVFSQILYWLAFLTHKKAKFIEAHKGQTLDIFLAITKDPSYLNVTDILEVPVLKEYYFNGHKRFKTTCMIYKDLLQEDKLITKRILDNFDKLHTLIHV